MSKTKHQRNQGAEAVPPPIAETHTRQEVADAQRTHGLEKLEKPLARCTGCGATVMEVVNTRTLHYQGYYPPKACPGGQKPQPYTGVVRQRARCRACGRVAILVSRPFDPQAWEGPAPDPF